MPVSEWGLLTRDAGGNPEHSLSALAGREATVALSVPRLGSSSECEVVKLIPGDDHEFWALFSKSPYTRELCGAILRGKQEFDGGWSNAALQLSIVTCWGRFSRLTSATQVQDRLLQAFLAETKLVGGIAVTKVVPEMLRAGIALTGRPGDIHEIAALLGDDSETIDADAVAHSVELGSPWPR
jgi:hypothetical protein